MPVSGRAVSWKSTRANCSIGRRDPGSIRVKDVYDALKGTTGRVDFPPHGAIDRELDQLLLEYDEETEASPHNKSLRELAELELKRLEVWIDGDGYNRRTVIEMALGNESTMAMDIRMSDFNQEITIELPQNYQEYGLP